MALIERGEIDPDRIMTGAERASFESSEEKVTRVGLSRMIRRSVGRSA
jgi:hypothetical protein